DNANYTKAVLEKGEDTHSLKIAFVRDAVKASGDFLTPWRTISFSRTAVGLGRYTDLLLKLCPPPKAGIPRWIRPGKLIRSQLTTKSGRDCIDFAASHNFQYVLFDAGWYGKEFNSVSDPTTYIDGLDIPGVIKYGRSKNIGIILYVNYVGLRKYLDRILPLYKSWGVSGMKFGFVNGLTREGISWLMAAVKKASAEGFVIDIHDNYKPTGMSRIYPALLTQEGVRGNEHGPDAFHNTVLPFTRFLSGAADYTFCYPGSDTGFNHYLEKEKLKVSKAQQLALSVIYFSPLQSMLWYGRPSYYTNETDIEFFKEVPTVWDRSIYLKGGIGQYASIARKQGQDWFIGSISGPDEWSDKIRLDFLDKGITYKAEIYEDDGKGHIKKKELYCKRSDFLPVHLAAGSGQAIRLSPSIKKH
ncbi:MAG TPA: glycoside hydrolase family 97 catalytic domain-containing protein, partial [Chitinophagaceae bacterium]